MAHHSKKRIKDFDESLIERELGSTSVAEAFDNVLGHSRDSNAIAGKGV